MTKKIMFSDKYGLTDAVLDGIKTQTRRIVPDRTLLGNFEETLKSSRYDIGEVVAIAQSYHDIGLPPTECIGGVYYRRCDEPGWTNKLFVKPSLMPYRIKITDIRVERLQDISHEDCLKEGIRYYDDRGHGYMFDEPQRDPYRRFCSSTPIGVFSLLIDKVSGKGTWDSNPWVFVYDFELVK